MTEDASTAAASARPLSEMIEAEDAALDRVTEFIREGMLADRISAETGELLIDTAEINHSVTVQRLRQDSATQLTVWQVHRRMRHRTVTQWNLIAVRVGQPQLPLPPGNDLLVSWSSARIRRGTASGDASLSHPRSRCYEASRTCLGR
jgi:hypothetical protein